MRAALWFLALFGAAVAVALFAGNNQAVVTVFWPPWRIDLALNLVLIALLVGFIVVHSALRGMAVLRALPQQTRRWRVMQRERTMHGALLGAYSYMLSGRFLRARKDALTAIGQSQALEQLRESDPHTRQMRALAHLIAAESSHALQDRETRQTHLEQAQQTIAEHTSDSEREFGEGLQLRAARWALDDRDAESALEQLASLPAGTARRTLALRTRLKAARHTQQTDLALETARLLAKHGAFAPSVADTLTRSLLLEQIRGTRDTHQLLRIWQQLDAAERSHPDIATRAAQQLSRLGGEPAQVRQWLTPVWQALSGQGEPDFNDAQWLRLVRTLERNMQDLEDDWLARIESAQRARPREPHLQYLAAAACMHRQLWGKAQQGFARAVQQLRDERLRASAWRHLAELAEQRGDGDEAVHAWKQAALLR